MSAQRTLLLLLTSVLALAASGAARGASAENPYRQISQRNVFCLVPPAPVVTAPPHQQPLPTIKLTGITTIFHDKRAVLKIQFPDTGREVGCILSEHQSIETIQILEIDEKAAGVRVNNSGTVMTLTFASNQNEPLKPVGLPPLPPVPK